MSPSFDDPARRTMESMIIPRRQINDNKEHFIPLPRSPLNPTPPRTFNAERNFRVTQNAPLHSSFFLRYRRIGYGARSASDEIGEGIGYSIYVCEFCFVYCAVVRVEMWMRSVRGGRWRRGFAGLACAGEKRFEGIGRSFDLFYASSFDRTKVDNLPISRRDLSNHISSRHGMNTK